MAVLLITFGMGLSSMGQIRFISPELASKVEFIGLAVLGVLVAVSLTLVRLAKGLCTSDCLGFRPAVRYLGWYGTCHSFEIQSESYAFAFMKANERKLVNVHPVVQAKLAAGAEAGSAQFVQKRVG